MLLGHSGQCVLTSNGYTQAARDLSRLGSGEKDLPTAKAERPTERVRWSQFQQVTLKLLRWGAIYVFREFVFNQAANSRSVISPAASASVRTAASASVA